MRTRVPADASIVAVIAETTAQQEAAERLACELGLPLVSENSSPGEGMLLRCGPGRLELLQPGPAAPGPVAVDFVAGRAAHRRRFGGGRGQPLARAVGLKQGRTPSVLDMTAGLGRDAFVLASLGCEVDLAERSPVIHALLADGLRRAQLDPETAPVVARMRLWRLDSLSLEPGQLPGVPPEVVYLDPMYPHRCKSAQVKKEMRLFQVLLGDEPDSAGLLQVALGLATRRVVVKRPARAESLDGSRPTLTISSPNTRYDVYLIAGGST